MPGKPTRTYSSPLRDRQVQRTRGLILDALTDLLAERPADQVTTREIADRAGVSQPTVYRHFPDREALLAGLADRLHRLTDDRVDPSGITCVDDFGPTIRRMFEASDDHAIEATAEALLNADPRRFSPDTSARSDRLRDMIAAEFTDLDDGDRLGLAALLRCIGSAQTWLRMREEFGVPGTESGPLVEWAIGVLLAEAGRGRPEFTDR